MKPKLILAYTLLSFWVIGTASADYSDGWDAYNKNDYLNALVEWLPLAEQGDSQAQYNIAGMYSNGYGVKVDDEKAVYWYQKAANQGHPKAQYNLGVMYLLGTGIYQSFEDAKPWLQLSYENGVDEAEIIWNQNELWKY